MSGGGDMTPKDIPYSPPVGPTNINDSKSPGIHGDNCGNCGTQEATSTGGQSSGSVGLHGDSHGTGTNRG